MKITALELFKVPPRWLFLKISTDAGLSGWGEPVVEGRADTVKACVEELAGYLVGRDPRPIEDHYQVLYRAGFYRGGPVLMSAISGIEQALWDLKGQALGVPAYELLGGPVRDRVRVYSWVGGNDLAALGAMARTRVAAGYTALKMSLTEQVPYLATPALVDEAAARLAAVRAAVGPGVDIGVDFHGRIHRGLAKVLLAAIAPSRPLFVEEPVLPEHLDALPELHGVAPIPIATGERLYGRADFKTLLARGGVDVIQPDLSHAGGLWECRKIAAMAEAYDVVVAPHCPLGPIAFAASLQLAGCTPNFLLQEQALDLHAPGPANVGLSYLRDPAAFRFAGGQVPLPTGPGLGIAIDEDKVRAAAKVGHNWKSPVWRLPDGSVAEW